ncbi:MAG: hypothetical protein ABJF88_14100 [Rhodothermales bacterium]
MPTLRALIVLLLATMALAACDEAVEPTLGEERPFTLLGQLDAEADTQAVRVVPIAPTIDTLDPDAIDAAVTSTTLQSGEVRVWRDSLVQYADGSQGHVFFAPFRAGYEEAYRLDVTRSDGEAATVTVTVPPLTDVDSLAREGAFSDPRYVVGVQDAPRLSGVQARYEFVGDVPRFQVVRHSELVERVPGGWRVAIPFVADVQRLIAASELGEVGLRSFEVSVFVSNEEWNVDAAGGAFDPEVLVQPGTLSNVENGFGFFGAGYRTGRFIVPTAQDQIRAGLCLLNAERTGCAE